MLAAFDTVFELVELRPGDRVVVLTDLGSDAELGRRLFQTALDKGADATWSQIQIRTTNGDNPPEPVVAAIQASDLAFLITSWSATHATGVIEAARRGVRVLSMPGVHLGMFERGAMTADYDRVQSLTERWGEHFARGQQIHLTTKAGTDIRADLGSWSRLPLVESGRMPHGVGGIGNLPSGEVAICPIEGTTEGRVVTDLTMSTTLRPLQEPVVIYVERGRIVDVQGGAEAADLRAALQRNGESANAVAEIALGTNPAALHVGSIVEDEKALGSAHLGFGHAIGLGGTNASTIHIDAIFAAATAIVDDLPLLIDGQVTSEGLARESLASVTEHPGAFRLGSAETEARNGRLFVAWQDLRRWTYWSQVGDDSAAQAAADFLARGRLEAQAGTDEARLCALLERYRVLTPALVGGGSD